MVTFRYGFAKFRVVGFMYLALIVRGALKLVPLFWE